MFHNFCTHIFKYLRAFKPILSPIYCQQNAAPTDTKTKTKIAKADYPRGLFYAPMDAIANANQLGLLNSI